MSGLVRAEELVQEIKDHLADSELENVHVTLDLLEIPSALASGLVAVLQPPELEFETWDATTAKWELVIISGTYQDRLVAWSEIDPVIQALKTPLAIDSAKPANYQHPSLPDHPAYVLTFDENI